MSLLAPVAQRIERSVADAEVGGSSPFGRTISFRVSKYHLFTKKWLPKSTCWNPALKWKPDLLAIVVFHILAVKIFKKNRLSFCYNYCVNAELIEHAKKLMEEGWKAREALDFDTAEKLLTRAKETFTAEEDWFNLTEALNHLAYTKKLRGATYINEGFEIAQESINLARKYKVNLPSPLRAALSLANAIGNFELEIKYCQEAVALMKASMFKADLMSHLALCLLRTGKVDEAEKIVVEAEELFKKNWEEEREPHRSIWKCKMLRTKGLILYNKGNLAAAKKLGEEAKQLAVEKDLKVRIVEAENFLALF